MVSKASSSSEVFIDEDVFDQAFAAVPPLSAAVKDIPRLIDEICETLARDDVPHPRKIKSLVDFRSLINTDNPQAIDVVLGKTNTYNRMMADGMKELRSQLLREYCITVAFYAVKLGIKFYNTAAFIYDRLILLPMSKAKVISQSGSTTLRYIAREVQTEKVIMLLHSTINHRGRDVRVATYAAFIAMITSFPVNILQKQVNFLKDAILNGLNDAEPAVRNSSRDAYMIFRNHFKAEADEIYGALQPNRKRLLDVLEFPEVPITSAVPKAGIPKAGSAKSERYLQNRSQSLTSSAMSRIPANSARRNNFSNVVSRVDTGLSRPPAPNGVANRKVYQRESSLPRIVPITPPNAVRSAPGYGSAASGGPTPRSNLARTAPPVNNLGSGLRQPSSIARKPIGMFETKSTPRKPPTASVVENGAGRQKSFNAVIPNENGSLWSPLIKQLDDVIKPGNILLIKQLDDTHKPVLRNNLVTLRQIMYINARIKPESIQSPDFLALIDVFDRVLMVKDPLFDTDVREEAMHCLSKLLKLNRKWFYPKIDMLFNHMVYEVQYESINAVRTMCVNLLIDAFVDLDVNTILKYFTQILADVETKPESTQFALEVFSGLHHRHPNAVELYEKSWKKLTEVYDNHRNSRTFSLVRRAIVFYFVEHIRRHGPEDLKEKKLDSTLARLINIYYEKHTTSVA